MNNYMTRAQYDAWEALSSSEPRSAYDIGVSLATLRALCNKGRARDVTPSGAGGMFSPRTHYKFLRIGDPE